MLYFSAICAIAITCIACCVKRFMRKKREADLEKKESKGKNGVDLKVRIKKNINNIQDIVFIIRVTNKKEQNVFL